MKKTSFILLLFCFSCRINNLRSFTEGYVYDWNSKKPVKNAIVYIWEGYDNGFIKITETDLKGYFSFNKKSRVSIGNNGRDLATQFIIKKHSLVSDTLISYGGNDSTKIDSILLHR